MKLRALLEQVQKCAPFAPEEAERAVRVVVPALASYLSAASARQLLAELHLPGLSSPESAEPPSLRALAVRVAEGEQIELPRALEHARIVGAALIGQLEGALLTKVRGELPESLLQELLGAGGHEAPAAGQGHRPLGDASTLAAGRAGSSRSLATAAPGSAHPLSEARPRQAQQNSVVAPNPHADTKLSSAEGMTQEREHESLADGRSKAP